MPAYVIADIDVTDPEGYEEYKRLAPPTIRLYAGRYLARGGQAETLEGDWTPGRLVILEFPDREHARRWLESSEYGPARSQRHRTARTRMVVVDGVDGVVPGGSTGRIRMPFEPEVTAPEIYVSVDVEASGPSPGRYSLLSLGACLVDDPARTFYAELQPIGEAATSEAMAVHNLDLAALKRDGLPPAEAMKRFEAWLKAVVPAGALPVFVGFNAAFDWMFVADYFDRFLGRNPFGHTALDLKAYYMGLTGGAWSDTTKRALAVRYPDHPELTHNALQDAIDQAALFRRMRAEHIPPPHESP